MRGMNRFGSVAAGFLIAVGCGITTSDVAATTVTRNSITATVTALPSAFPQSAYGAYEFTLTNNSSGSFNNGRLRAKLMTEGAEFLTGATPVEAGKASCDFLSATEIDCLIGNGTVAVGASITFSFQVKTPAGTEVKLVWNVRPGEGDSTSWLPGEETTALSSDSTSGDTAKLATVVPPSGYFVYTGDNNRPKTGDKHTTAADVYPQASTLIIASITEGTAAEPNGVCQRNSARYCSSVAVETGTGQKAMYDPFDPSNSTLAQKLTIVLRVDAVEVAGLNINTAQIWYTPDGKNGFYLPNCPKPSKGTYVPTSDYDPCIQSRTVLSKKLGADLAGDWELVIFALSNGRFEIE
jgi:hypothetical protein